MPPALMARGAADMEAGHRRRRAATPGGIEVDAGTWPGSARHCLARQATASAPAGLVLVIGCSVRGRPLNLRTCHGHMTMSDATPLITGVDFVCIPAQNFDAMTGFYGQTLGLPFRKRYRR